MRFPWFKFNGSSLLVWVAGVITAGFVASASIDLWRYQQLQTATPATVVKWKIIEKSSSQFALKAFYTFELQGKTHQGKTIFGKPYHLNRPSAERQIQLFQKQSWVAWVRPSNPRHSTVDKRLPLKKSLYALMTLGIAIYFVTIRLRYAAY